MKTLPIRCRPNDTRPIRAIANEAPAPAPGEPKRRDNCPTHQFIQQAKDTLPSKWEDLMAVLNETALNGPPNNDQKFSSLKKNGLYEFKSFKLRIACFFDGNLIICTHGFFKKQNQTPKGEVDYADEKRRDYFEAKKNGTLTHAQPRP